MEFICPFIYLMTIMCFRIFLGTREYISEQKDRDPKLWWTYVPDGEIHKKHIKYLHLMACYKMVDAMDKEDV
jgi:hypothetical protein